MVNVPKFSDLLSVQKPSSLPERIYYKCFSIKVKDTLKCYWLKGAIARYMWLNPSPLKEQDQFEELSESQ